MRLLNRMVSGFVTVLMMRQWSFLAWGRFRVSQQSFSKEERQSEDMGMSRRVWSTPYVLLSDRDENLSVTQEKGGKKCFCTLNFDFVPLCTLKFSWFKCNEFIELRVDPTEYS